MDEAASLRGHLELLRAEHRKLQQRAAELERLAGSQIKGSLSEKLLEVVTRAFDDGTFSDITINVAGQSIPAHKLVLACRGSWGPKDMLETSDTLDLNDMSYTVAKAMIRWVYTDTLDDMGASRQPSGDTTTFYVELLRAAHRFQLAPLASRCEHELTTLLCAENAVTLLLVARDVEASTLKEFAMAFIMENWVSIPGDHFDQLDAQLFYDMIKLKSPYPLHVAVGHGRQDVVFLYLLEHDLDLQQHINRPDQDGVVPLALALKKKHMEIAKNLVSHNCDVNFTNANGNTLLHNAILSTDTQSAKFLIESKADVSRPTVDGKTPLHLAAEMNEQDTVSDLLERGADINAPDTNGNTPTHVAIKAGNAPLVSFLLEQPKCDPNIRNTEGHTALWLALGLADQTIAKALVERGCDINLVSSSGDTMVHEAIRQNNADAALFLISHGCSLSKANAEGRTPLHLAAEMGLQSVVENIVHRDGVDVNVRTTALQTPLTLAVMNGQLECASVLLSHVQTDVDARDAEGQTALAHALSNGQIQCADLLVSKRADIEATSPAGDTLLHQAILRGDDQSCLFLLTKGANVSARTTGGLTALQLAVQQRLPETVRGLCQNGANVNETDSDGQTPLTQALVDGQHDIASALLQAGSDVNATTAESGLAVLHVMVQRNDADAVRMLLRHGADPNARQPNTGATALHLACELGNDALPCIKELLMAGADVNAVDAQGNTPAHKAILAQDSSLAIFLVKNCPINYKLHNADGLTVFGAAVRVLDPHVAAAILDKCPEAKEFRNQAGLTLLHAALEAGDGQRVQFLLRFSVDVNAPAGDSSSRLPLNIAVERNLETEVERLLAAGARHDVPDPHSKWTAAHIAASLGFANILAALMRHGASMAARNDIGDNALHIAVEAGHRACVRLLLERGQIRPDSKNGKGQSPIHLVCKSGRQEAEGILVDLLPLLQGEVNPQDDEGCTPLYYAYAAGAVRLCTHLVKHGAHPGIPNSHGGTIFDLKVPSRKLLFHVLQLLPKEPEWIEHPNCQVCHSKFKKVNNRKHHCRHCGRILCGKCSSQSIPIIKFGYEKPARVCDACFQVLSGSGGPQ